MKTYLPIHRELEANSYIALPILNLTSLDIPPNWEKLLGCDQDDVHGREIGAGDPHARQHSKLEATCSSRLAPDRFQVWPLSKVLQTCCLELLSLPQFHLLHRTARPFRDCSSRARHTPNHHARPPYLRWKAEQAFCMCRHGTPVTFLETAQTDSATLA